MKSQSIVKLATIEHFFAQIENPKAQSFFMGMLAARAAGYSPDYEKPIVPFDTTDFVARHHLFCLSQGQDLFPIGGFKHATLSRCDRYDLPFPMLNIVRATNSAPHIEAVENIVQEHRSGKKELLYGGSFAIRKTHRGDKEFSKLIHELMAALTYLDFTENNISAIVGIAALRFKTERLFEAMGYRTIAHHGVPLDNTVARFANNEPVVLIKLDEPSRWARECYEKHQLLLRSRLILNPLPNDQTVTNKAA